MKQFELPYFNRIDVENITAEQEYLMASFQDREIGLMWFVEEELNQEYFDNANNILQDLDAFDVRSKSFLQQEFTNEGDGTVLEYLEYHLEELGEEMRAITGDVSE